MSTWLKVKVSGRTQVHAFYFRPGMERAAKRATCRIEGGRIVQATDQDTGEDLPAGVFELEDEPDGGE